MDVRGAIKSGKFYTYVHIRLDTNKVFYVGKGVARRVLEKGRHRSKWWNRVVAKHGYRSEILFVHATEQSALSAEKFFIEAFRADGHELVNLTDGGDGCVGLVMSDEARLRCRISKLGDKNPSYGKKGIDSQSFKGKIIATNAITGEIKIMFGPEDLRKNGFKPPSVYRLLSGKEQKRHTHKGHTFKRVIDQ
jgi:hypothetical protein